MDLRRSFSLLESTFLRTYDPGFRFFVKQIFKWEGKIHSKIAFSCKNRLKQWGTEHLYCASSPLVTYTINEYLSACSGFARTIAIYCQPNGTILLMSTAYRHTLWTRNLFIVIIQQITHVRSIVTLITLTFITAYDSTIFTIVRTKIRKRIIALLFAKVFKLVFLSPHRSG